MSAADRQVMPPGDGAARGSHPPGPKTASPSKRLDHNKANTAQVANGAVPFDWAGVRAADAEAAVLGSLMLLPPGEAAELVGRLTEDDFTSGAHLTIFTAVTGLLSRGVPADPITVLADLRMSGAITDSAAPTVAVRLAELIERVPSTAAAGHYAGAVLDAALRRRIQQVATRLHHAAEAEPLDSLVRLVGAEVIAVYHQVRRRQRPAADVGAPARLQVVS